MLMVASSGNIRDIAVDTHTDMAAAAITNIFESNAPLQGARATEAAHRRIELQSPEVSI
jgi:flagellar motor protein MotB